MMRLADRSRKARVVARSSAIADPSSRPTRSCSGSWSAGGCSSTTSASATRSRRRPGCIRGFSFSPDSASVVFGTAGAPAAQPTRRPTCTVVARGRGAEPGSRATASRSTRCGRRGIVHDRMRAPRRRRPSYNLCARSARRRQPAPDHDAADPDADERPRAARAVRPTAGGCSRTSSARTRGSAFRVNLVTGKAKALDDDFENGLVGFDLSADGRTVLGHTGGPDPTARHNVVTVPYGGGDRQLVRRGFPDWISSRRPRRRASEAPVGRL